MKAFAALAAALVAVYAFGATAATRAGLAGTARLAGRAVQVQIPGQLFAPGDLTVLVGDTVTWTNGDSTRHTVTSEDDVFDQALDPGASFTYTFTQPGIYRYHCSIHRFMRGTVHAYQLALAGPDRPVPYGRTAVLKGLAPASATAVTVRRFDPTGATPFVTVKPAADGTFAVRVPARTPARYQASSSGAASPVVPVAVSPTVNITVQYAGGRPVLVVRTTPALPGARIRVDLYQRDYFRWSPLTTGQLGAGSSARILLGALDHVAHIRAVVFGARGYASGASHAVRVN